MNFRWEDHPHVSYLWSNKLYQVCCYGVVRRIGVSNYYRYSYLTTLNLKDGKSEIETDDRPSKELDDSIYMELVDVRLSLDECKELLLKHACLLYEKDQNELFLSLHSGDYRWDCLDVDNYGYNWNVLYIGSDKAKSPNREMGVITSFNGIIHNYESVFLENKAKSKDFISLEECKQDMLSKLLIKLKHV